MDDSRTGGLVAWQWSLYRDGHTDRSNLLVHALTVPLFWAGTLAPIAALLISPWLALGLLGMIGAVALQGRGHRRERVRPVPFRGAGDIVVRLFVEQWITFPRYVLSGGFARAWRTSGVRASHAA